MSLVGNLEDLGLGDILQIVSLSRKSGMLNLTWDERKGRIIFRDGQVIGAESNERPERIEKLLAAKGIATREDIQKAIALRKGLGPTQKLRDILVERLGADTGKIEDVLREHVEQVVFNFFMWPEGNFSFDLKEGKFTRNELGDAGVELMLDVGLNPQFLAMEGTRLQDEARREGKLVPVPMPDKPEFSEESGGHEEAAPEGEAQTSESTAASAPGDVKAAPSSEEIYDRRPVRDGSFPDVIVIDDDAEILDMTTSELQSSGFTARGTLKISEGIELIRQCVVKGFVPVIMADLFMPRTDGEGILGGLELVRKVKAGVPYVPILLMSDYPNDAAAEEARKAGLDHYIDKPKRSQIWGDEPTPELLRFKDNIHKIIPVLVEKAAKTKLKPRGGKPAPQRRTTPAPRQETAPSPPNPAPTSEPAAMESNSPVVPGPPVASTDVLWDPGKEISIAIGEELGAPRGEEIPQTSRGLHLLKSMITELHDPESSGQVTLLILRFAAEIMNRAIIFLVMKDKVCGLGQFGVELNGVDPVKQIRRMRIPLDEPSIFRDVIFRKATYKKPLDDTKWNNYLVDFLGGQKPVESFAAPIITSGRVAAILYGDNVPEAESIGETDSLEIFLAQAGLSMERTLLERRLSEISLKEGRSNARSTVES